MMHPMIFLVAFIVLNCCLYGACASPAGDDIDGKPIVRREMSVFSSSSSSTGPFGWTSTFSGPQTGGSVISFSSHPFSSKGKVHISKSQSTSDGIKQMESHVINLASGEDYDDMSTQLGSFVSEEDDEIMPLLFQPKWKPTSADKGVHNRLLGLGGTRSSSGLLGLGLGIL